MSTSGNESWRVAVFTDFPGIAQAYEQLFSQHGHKLVAVVTSPKRNPDYLEVARGLSPGIDVLISNHPKRWAAMLEPLRPDLLVATTFPWRFPADLLALPRLGAINAHPALLPTYRGTGTPMWLFRNGEPKTGWTLHRMANDFDIGPILAQTSFAIDDDDDWPALVNKYVTAFWPLWEQALPRIAAGDPGDPQDESQASYYGAFPDDESWLGH
jgi:methionyl-tRNA formyltransferase